jgi:hypothetical protein
MEAVFYTTLSKSRRDKLSMVFPSARYDEHTQGWLGYSPGETLAEIDEACQGLDI